LTPLFTWSIMQPMPFRKAIPRLGVVILLAVSAFADEKPWREVRSPHFRVITNGTETSGRHVARSFEQMRSMFAQRFPTFRLDPPAPLLIFAPIDEPTTKKLLPEFWEHSGPKPAGNFEHRWVREYAVVRLDVIGSDKITPDVYAVVCHEYVHSIMHLNVRWLPTWLNEGLAEFYSYTRFEGKNTYIGAPPKNIEVIRILHRRASIPLGPFIERRGSFTRDEGDTEMFYAQSWALTHFLILGPGMGNGERLNRFFNALQQGTEQKKAFQDVFGPLDQVQKDFDKYLSQFAFLAGVIPSPPQADDQNYESRVMPASETQAEMACYLAHKGYGREARALAEAALKSDPKSALAHETIGILNLEEGKVDDAAHEFAQATELDSTLYFSLFAKTMLSPLSHSNTPADREAYRTELLRVLNVNPQFAPAFVELAKAKVADGDLDHAAALSRTAEKYEPSRAGYHLLTGQILLRMGHPAEAAVYATYVANRWSGQDHDEALELWNLIPEPQRPAEHPSNEQLPPGVSTAEGKVKSVSCKNHEMALTLDQAGQPVTYRFQRGSWGFSDTFWVGDYFNPCHATIGTRAVVRYKPAADKSQPAQATNIGFRDDLPARWANAGQPNPQALPK
jgi:Tfp pilus assembly protein PilF